MTGKEQAAVSALVLALAVLFMVPGCSENGKNAVRKTASTPDDSRLFNRFGTPGCEASFGLAALEEDVTGAWSADEKDSSGTRYLTPLHFCPDDPGVGVLVMDGEEVPERTESPGRTAAGPCWSLEGGRPFYPMGKDFKFRISQEEGKSVKSFTVKARSTEGGPLTRLLLLTLRGMRTANRYPVLEIYAGDKRVFHEVIPHPKPHPYAVSFVQAKPSLTLKMVCGSAEASAGFTFFGSFLFL